MWDAGCLYDLCNVNTACLHPSSHNTTNHPHQHSSQQKLYNQWPTTYRHARHWSKVAKISLKTFIQNVVQIILALVSFALNGLVDHAEATILVTKKKRSHKNAKALLGNCSALKINSNIASFILSILLCVWSLRQNPPVVSHWRRAEPKDLSNQKSDQTAPLGIN